MGERGLLLGMVWSYKPVADNYRQKSTEKNWLRYFRSNAKAGKSWQKCGCVGRFDVCSILRVLNLMT